MGRRHRLLGPPIALVIAAITGSCDGGDERANERAIGSAGASPDAGSSDSSRLQIEPPSFESGPPFSETYDAGDAGPQPVVACGDAGIDSDASVGASDDCAAPESRCLDARGLLYYENGRCVDGRCVWDQKIFVCREQCIDRGCYSNVTAAAPQ